MKRATKYLIITFCLFFYEAEFGFAQELNLTAEMENISNNFLNRKEHYMQIQYSYFENWSASAPTETKTSSYIKKNNVTYYSYVNTECLQTKDGSIIIDNDKKIIKCLEKNNTEEIKNGVLDLKDNLKNVLAYKVLNESKNIRTLSIEYKNNTNGINKVLINYNTKSYQVYKTELFYKYEEENLANPGNYLVSPRLIVEYVYTKNKGANKKLKKSGFVKKTLSGWEPAQAYKGYSIEILN